VNESVGRMGSGASSNKEQQQRIKVLIVGGGYAGIQAAVALNKAGIGFILVDPKEYFHHCVGALRAAVIPEYVNKTAIPYKEAFGDRFVQDKVMSLDVENKKAALEGGQELEWSHCLVCVGSLGPEPCRSFQVTMKGLEEESKRMAESISVAKQIVIVGGGAVGFELAGEIRDKYPDKDISIVSANKELVCSDFPPKFQSAVEYCLQNGNIKVLHGKLDLDNLKLNCLETQTLKVGDIEVEADLVIPCIGLPPNTKEAARLLPEGCFDMNGRVKVDEYFRVSGCPDVFAIGDICNTSEHKMAAHAATHADTVVANILLEAAGKQAKPYQQKFVGMIVPFGAKAGLGSINGWNLPSFLCVKLKSADLFSSKYWSDVGLQMPA